MPDLGGRYLALARQTLDTTNGWSEGLAHRRSESPGATEGAWLLGDGARNRHLRGQRRLEAAWISPWPRHRSGGAAFHDEPGLWKTALSRCVAHGVVVKERDGPFSTTGFIVKCKPLRID